MEAVLVPVEPKRFIFFKRSGRMGWNLWTVFMETGMRAPWSGQPSGLSADDRVWCENTRVQNSKGARKPLTVMLTSFSSDTNTHSYLP